MIYIVSKRFALVLGDNQELLEMEQTSPVWFRKVYL